MNKVIAFCLAVALSLPLYAASWQEDGYELVEAVVLSRHNIRSPLSGPGSAISRITPHKWFEWTSAPAELSKKGAVLETRMGQFFAEWMEDEDLFSRNALPAPGEVRIYSNSMQRTIATARYFSAGMFPVANIDAEYHCPVGTMDPVFHPQITDASEEFVARAMDEIVSMGGDEGMSGLCRPVQKNLALIGRILDMRKAPAAANDTISFRTDDIQVKLTQNAEPFLSGGLKLARNAADALILQYYEDPSPRKAAFGHRLSHSGWEDVAEVIDLYHHILFGAPSVAVQVARPLLRTILSELNAEGRKFSFLCGHDSNIYTVLTALQCEEIHLPEAIEKSIPIGCKIVICKWRGNDGGLYADLRMVYGSDAQIRSMSPLSLQNPPVSVPVYLKGLKSNQDGKYLLADLEERIIQVINTK